MALSSTAALVAVQDGAGAVVNQSAGAVAAVTPGALVTFSLQSTSGVARWEVAFNCPNFPALHQVVYTWFPGQANQIQVQLPPDSFVGSYISTVSDGQASVQFASGKLATKGNNAVPVQHIARLATQAALSAYTNVSGVLTANANGALGTIDGVAPAVGDLVLLTLGAAGADNGLYQVTSLGGASSKFVFTLAPDWQQGSTLLAGTTIEVTEGNTGPMTWKVMTSGNSVVGTTSIAIYPRLSNVTTGAAVAGVTPANTANWVFATSSPVLAVPVTPGGTQGIWRISTQTAGATGSSSLRATSSSNTDTSTVLLTVINF